MNFLGVSKITKQGCCVLDAEIRFLPHLIEINKKFPKLRIVLEHCTTAAAIKCVESLPSTVSATITPHHLALTIDQAVASTLGYCKPLAKYPSDRAALRAAVASGNPKFFLGSDSAPHPSSSKLPALSFTTNAQGEEEATLPSPCAAGIYTSADLLPLLATIFESSNIPLDKLEGFASTHGRKFYGYPAKEGEKVVLKRVVGGKPVEKTWAYEKDNGGSEWVIPFMAGANLGWEL